MPDAQPTAAFILTAEMVTIGLSLAIMPPVWRQCLEFLGRLKPEERQGLFDARRYGHRARIRLFFVAGLVALAFSVAIGAGAVIGVAGIATGTSIGPYGPENFTWGKWFSALSLSLFVSGLWLTGIGYMGVAILTWRNRTDLLP